MRDERRIVSLIASATEIVCALGFEKQLVGRSHECDYPSSVQQLPVCTKPRFNIVGSSREIDVRVKDLLREGLSIYEVFSDEIGRLKPDVIVTQSHCEVCAVSLKDVERALCNQFDFTPHIVSLEPNGLADIWESIRKVGHALQAEDEADRLILGLNGRIDTISKIARNYHHHPTVACIEWFDPLMSAGNWVPELVELAGGRNLFGSAGKHSPWMEWSDLISMDPDVIVLMPCGWDIPKCESEASVLLSRPEWNGLKAVQNGRIFVTDGNQYFNRPGPRLAESLEILAEILHPHLFNYGHGNVGWKPFIREVV